MALKELMAAASGVIVASALSMPADAAKKKQPAYRADSTSGTSLDGRVTGYPRTCWHDAYVRDHRGVPMGPYCH